MKTQLLTGCSKLQSVGSIQAGDRLQSFMQVGHIGAPRAADLVWVFQ